MAEAQPRITQKPAISGKAIVGSPLTVTAAWDPTTGVPAYQWLRCDVPASDPLADDSSSCVAIAGATATSYVAVGADTGRQLAVRLTVTWPGGKRKVSRSDLTSAVAPSRGPVLGEAPSIVGSAVEGATVTGDGGAWSGGPDLKVSLAWMRCAAAGGGCAPIGGATRQSYVLTNDDVGHTLRLAVTATDAAGSASALSAPTSTVAAKPAAPPSASSPSPQATFASPGVTPTGASGAGPSQPAAGLALMRPFPVVRIAGHFSRARTVVTLATVRAPRGSRIAVRCRGRGCAARRRALTARVRTLGFLRRSYRPGATIELRITQVGAIGKYVRIVIRSGKPPARKDLCVHAAGGAPFRCPGG